MGRRTDNYIIVLDSRGSLTFDMTDKSQGALIIKQATMLRNLVLLVNIYILYDWYWLTTSITQQ